MQPGVSVDLFASVLKTIARSLVSRGYSADIAFADLEPLREALATIESHAEPRKSATGAKS